MRKRIWAVLLSVCLLVGLLPTTALAGGLTTVKTYEKLVAASESQTGEIWSGTGGGFRLAGDRDPEHSGQHANCSH